MSEFKKGDHVRHLELGTGVVVKIDKKTGAVWLKMDADGIVGTCSPFLLRRTA
jgi:hypothetical protein